MRNMVKMQAIQVWNAVDANYNALMGEDEEWKPDDLRWSFVPLWPVSEGLHRRI